MIKQKHRKKELLEMRKFYNTEVQKIIPKKDPLAIYIVDFSIDDEFTFIPGWNYIWKERRNLYIYPYPPEIENYHLYKKQLKLIKLPIKNIRYYAVDEEEVIENEVISGNIEVNSNASVSPVSFTNQVKTKVGPTHAKMIKRNNKQLCLFYQNNNKQNQIMIMDDKSYYAFYNIIPEKSLELVNEVKKEEIKLKMQKKRKS